MKGKRTYVLSVAEQARFDPAKFTAALKRRGFRFERDTCPIKLKQPWSKENMPDGSVVWSQWEEPKG